jgi:NADH pyrophosphatase NudC (nudix superfamily)
MAAPVPQNTNQPGMRCKVSGYHSYKRLSPYIILALTQKDKLIWLCFCLRESSKLSSYQEINCHRMQAVDGYK